MRDVEEKYPGLKEAQKGARPFGVGPNRIDNVKKSLAWALHNEPIIVGLDDFKRKNGWDPELVWVLEEDVAFSGKETKGMT